MPYTRRLRCLRVTLDPLAEDVDARVLPARPPLSANAPHLTGGSTAEHFLSVCVGIVHLEPERSTRCSIVSPYLVCRASGANAHIPGAVRPRPASPYERALARCTSPQRRARQGMSNDRAEQFLPAARGPPNPQCGAVASRADGNSTSDYRPLFGHHLGTLAAAFLRFMAVAIWVAGGIRDEALRAPPRPR